MNTKRSIGLFVFICALCHSAAQANITLYFDPSPQDVLVGQSFSIDILADLGTGPLDDIISAFEFTVNYDMAILLPLPPVVFGGYLGDGLGFPFGTSEQDVRYPDDGRPEPPAPGTFEVAEVSLMSDLELDAIQNPPDPILLFSMNFVALAETPTVLSISFVGLDQDVKGRNYQELGVNTRNGWINVPVPATAALMMLGLLGVGAARRRATRGERV